MLVTDPDRPDRCRADRHRAGENLKLDRQISGTARRSNIDVEAALARGITVTNTPGVLTDDTADMTMGNWGDSRRSPCRIAEGATHHSRRYRLGPAGRRQWIAGTFALPASDSESSAWDESGTALARRGEKLSACRIHYHNRRRVAPAIEEELDTTYWDSLDQMLARMDIVSVNCPHTPATYHLLSARHLKLMKPEAILVNTRPAARSSTRNAMVRQIEQGALAGSRSRRVRARAGGLNPRLVKLAPCGQGSWLLPHMASATIEGRIDMGEKGPSSTSAPSSTGTARPTWVLPRML